MTKNEPDTAKCERRGGKLAACSTGPLKANRCVNSTWGENKIFPGPCRCTLCHHWREGRKEVLG